MVKHLPTMQDRSLGSIPGLNFWRRKWQPTPVLLPGKSHGWKSLVGYSLPTMWDQSLGSIPGSGRSSGEGNGNPLQYSCLENPMDGRAWQATVRGVAKSRTRLSDFTSLYSKISVLGKDRSISFLLFIAKLLPILFNSCTSAGVCDIFRHLPYIVVTI